MDELTDKIIGAGIEVHRELGPGLLESAYQACMVYELRQRGLHVVRQKTLPVVYKGISLDCGYRIDMIVENRVVLELKCVDRIDGIHVAQLLTYLKLSHFRVGLLMNFKSELLKNGIRRLVNGY